LNFLFNILPSPIYVFTITWVLQSCKPAHNSVWYCFLTPAHLASQIKSFPVKRLCCWFTYCQSFPNCIKHQIVISITVSSPETSPIWYTQMPSPIYQYVISQVVSLTIREGPGVLLNVSAREHLALNNEIFWCSKAHFSNTFIITIPK
jgi:hypothetical protein